MQIETRRLQVSDNNLKAQRDTEAFIKEAEDRYNSEIRRVAEGVRESIESKSIMMICGPSASGKTTTAGKIRKILGEYGIKAPVVSLDDFYFSTEKLPRTEDGKIDFESVYGLDLELLWKCFRELIETGKADFPRYDFNIKKQIMGENHIEIGAKDILIIEGIHALNPVISEKLDKDSFINLYIEATAEFSNGDKVLLKAGDTRMIRRMVRDYHHRASSLDNTMDMWKGVIDGEDKYIRPYIHLADYIVNTSHDYEPNIFHHYLFPLLEEALGKGSDYEETYKRLEYALDQFDDISKEYMPKDSLLQEFIL